MGYGGPGYFILPIKSTKNEKKKKIKTFFWSQQFGTSKKFHTTLNQLEIPYRLKLINNK